MSIATQIVQGSNLLPLQRLGKCAGIKKVSAIGNCQLPLYLQRSCFSVACGSRSGVDRKKIAGVVLASSGDGVETSVETEQFLSGEWPENFSMLNFEDLSSYFEPTIFKEEVAETRFASHTIVMRRLVKVKEALCQMVISNQWGIWKVASSERAQKVKSLILDDNWWARVQYVLDFTDPIMTMLRFADRDTPCLGDVYDGMDTTVEKVKLQIQKHENDPIECEALCNKVEGIILHRWEKMTNPLHLLAYALSPRYYSDEVLSMPGRIASYMDEEVTTGSSKAFVRLFPDKEMQTKVRQEFGLFSSGEKLSPYAINDRNNMELGAITWWYMYGQPFKYLQPLAIKILSQVASSSATERNWSTYSFIHSVKRNRLGSKKAEDLVYIHTNLRLLSRKEEDYKKGPSKLWDVTPECANLDATIQDLTKTMDDGDNTISTRDIGASSTSGTALASNDLELAAHGDDENVDFLANPYDSGSDY